MKNYQKPVLIADDVLSESVYMASGDADCWTIAVSKDQADAGGYATFRIQANHATNLQHISKATTIVLQFNQPVTEAAYDNPRFVEDVVREVYLGLKKMNFKWFNVEAETEESIHFHNAYACAEFSGK